MKWLIVGAAVAIYAALILITWVHYKKSKWPKEPPTPIRFGWLIALTRRASTAIIAMFAWIWPVSKWLWAWPKRSWKSEKTKKATKVTVATLALAAAIVLVGFLVFLLPEIFPLSGGTPPLLDTKLPRATITSSVNFEVKMQVLFISFFATVVLTFTLIARAAKKSKTSQTPTPGSDKKYDETKPGTAAPKKTQNLGWLGKAAWTILGLATLGTFALWLVNPEAMEPVKRWTERRFPTPNTVDTLRCGTGDYIKLPMKREVTVAVMSGDVGWTDWLLRPYNSMGSLTIAPCGELDIEVRFADGSYRLFRDFKPTTEVVVRNKKITGMRFRNNRDKPVRIEIQLS